MSDYFSLSSRPSPSVQMGKAWNRGYDYLLLNSQGDLAKHFSHYLPENPRRRRSRRNPSQKHDVCFSQNLSINMSNRAYPVKALFTLVHVYQTHKETWRNSARTIFLRIYAAKVKHHLCSEIIVVSRHSAASRALLASRPHPRSIIHSGALTSTYSVTGL